MITTIDRNDIFFGLAEVYIQAFNEEKPNAFMQHLAGVEAVARHVLADENSVALWRKQLFMPPPFPTFGPSPRIEQGWRSEPPLEHMHRLTGPSSQQIAATQHCTTEQRSPYDPARSTLKQRLDLASLSRAEGQE